MAFDRRFEITDARGGAAFTVRVVTRAETAEIVGIQDDGSLKIRLTAAFAGDPAANDELVRFLARYLGVAPQQLEIVAGANKREKLISVEGVSTAEVEARLGNLGSA